jgi:hypothetical protein
MISERNFQPDRNLRLMDQVRQVLRYFPINTALSRPVANGFCAMLANMPAKPTNVHGTHKFIKML